MEACVEHFSIEGWQTLMAPKVQNSKKIIVIGSGYSGSSAIVDYLVGRGDVYDPLAGQEFRLVQDPGGLVDLHHSVGSGFSFNSASRAVHDFESLARSFSRSPRALPPGLGYSELINDYHAIISSYLGEIVDVAYHGLPAVEMAKLSAFSAFLMRILRKFYQIRGGKPSVGRFYLPVQEERFLESTWKLLDRLLASNENSVSAVVVNQGGSFWKPLSSTQYYTNRHVVVVTRNPGDIFCEMISRGYAYPGRDVEAFCRWYKNIISRVSLDEWASKHVTHIRFEEFVKDYSAQSEYLSARIGLESGIGSSYDAAKSCANIGKYKAILSEREQQVIASSLEGFYCV